MLKKVYIVDDDPLSLFLAKNILTLYNINCKSSCYIDANQALDQLVEDALTGDLPDLVLLDLNMPLMSGFEFLRRLGSVCRGLEMECFVAILTSSIDEEDKKRCAESALVIDFLEKPLTNSMLHTITKAITKKNGPLPDNVPGREQI
ncbi:response regulator RpfG family c-di-GMP phosphodiesterase [Pontibacter aydingkolensis]|uniref:Response regulator n=1 Tax=Pontibacter aydingkolensis TaxID=1911536 RepID=A0ABS7CYL3_9BACT|nr:response regulator [Pontibacter aydingkolensis]MBW7468905.1 response regulator [Pontibacter aydingkolensis]